MKASENRRHFTRVPFDAEVTLTDPAMHRSWKTQLVDISLKGMLVSRPTDWVGTLEQALDVELPLSGSNLDKLKMEMRVAWMDSEHMGLLCEHMNLETATHLHRLVELNLGDETLLERELAELIKPTS